MIGIYLCDDEPQILSRLQTALEKKICMENYDMKVVCAADSAGLLLEAIQDSSRGIYFLDVDLKEKTWDGFSLGREIRRRDPHGILVYITSYGDLAWKTFQYHLEAFDYILKDGSQTAACVCRCLEAIQERLLEERRDPAALFSFRTGDETRHIPLQKILYFAASCQPHHVEVHTEDGWMDFVGSLNALEEALGDGFVRVHRSVLAAAERIDAVDWKKNLLVIQGRTCPLSRTGKAKLRKRWTEE